MSGPDPGGFFGTVGLWDQVSSSVIATLYHPPTRIHPECNLNYRGFGTFFSTVIDTRVYQIEITLQIGAHEGKIGTLFSLVIDCTWHHMPTKVRPLIGYTTEKLDLHPSLLKNNNNMCPRLLTKNPLKLA